MILKISKLNIEALKTHQMNHKPLIDNNPIFFNQQTLVILVAPVF